MVIITNISLLVKQMLFWKNVIIFAKNIENMSEMRYNN